MIRQREQGSVVSFVLIGLVLLALLAGGIYMVRHKIIAGDMPAPVSTTSTIDKNKDTQTTNSTDDLKAALEKQANEEKKAQEQQKAQQQETANSTTITSQSSSTPSSTSVIPTTGVNNAASSTTPAGSLPTTGPEDGIAALLGAVLLAAAGTAFMRSRRLA